MMMMMMVMLFTFPITVRIKTLEKKFKCGTPPQRVQQPM